MSEQSPVKPKKIEKSLKTQNAHTKKFSPIKRCNMGPLSRYKICQNLLNREKKRKKKQK